MAIHHGSLTIRGAKAMRRARQRYFRVESNVSRKLARARGRCAIGTLARTIPIALAGIATSAQASFLAGEALDKAADVLAWVVLILVPVIGIVLFWVVHVLPEKIAHKRHHPQTQAIQTLCLLSLVFGGMLWPFAWLWAYTKPVTYKLAYGTDRSEEYFVEQGEKARAGKLGPDELSALKTELDAMHGRGGLSAPLLKLREDIARLASAGATSADAPQADPGAPQPELRRA